MSERIGRLAEHLSCLTGNTTEIDDVCIVALGLREIYTSDEISEAIEMMTTDVSRATERARG